MSPRFKWPTTASAPSPCPGAVDVAVEHAGAADGARGRPLGPPPEGVHVVRYGQCPTDDVDSDDRSIEVHGGDDQPRGPHRHRAGGGSWPHGGTPVWPRTPVWPMPGRDSSGRSRAVAPGVLSPRTGTLPAAGTTNWRPGAGPSASATPAPAVRATTSRTPSRARAVDLPRWASTPPPAPLTGCSTVTETAPVNPPLTESSSSLRKLVSAGDHSGTVE